MKGFEMRLEDTESFASGDQGSPHWISAAEPRNAEPERKQEAEVDELSNDFEFAFVVRDIPDTAADDDIFTPVYPIFGRSFRLNSSVNDEEEKAIGVPLRRLIMEDRQVSMRSDSVSSSSSMDDREGIPAGNHCAWSPRSVPASPDRRKKSSSTGSRSRRWSLKDLVVGRSHSDGKDKLAILAAAENHETTKSKVTAAAAGVVSKGKGKKVTEMDMATAHRLFYSKGAGANAAAGGGGRRSFLPYKQGFVGFLGLSRTHAF